MSRGNTFDWLSGTVSIPSRAPEEWRPTDLDAFYRAPNDERWGGTLCRVLYHESIHFWQLLSSAFLANAVQAEWLRLLEFEQTGCLAPLSGEEQALKRRSNGQPFSAYELLECWARYWDVHTRSPARIVEEEQIRVPEGAQLRTQQGTIEGYTSQAFDIFMQEGDDARLYAAPYRWMLGRAGGHSAFVNIAFPILTFHAFGSPDPVNLLLKAFDRAWNSKAVQEIVDKRSYNINLDWLNSWGVFVTEAIHPAVRELQMPWFTGGWDVIARGALGRHPIYGRYSPRLLSLFRLAGLARPEPPEARSLEAVYAYAVADLPSRDPTVIFAFPGQPEYRLALGSRLPPPCVRFENFCWYSESKQGVQAMAKIAGTMGEAFLEEDRTFRSIIVDIESRIRRFRSAEYAVSIGLSPRAFD